MPFFKGGVGAVGADEPVTRTALDEAMDRLAAALDKELERIMAETMAAMQASFTQSTQTALATLQQQLDRQIGQVSERVAGHDSRLEVLELAVSEERRSTEQLRGQLRSLQGEMQAEGDTLNIVPPAAPRVHQEKVNKEVSIVARGKFAKAAVFKGKKAKTVGGLTKATLIKNKSGKIVSKAASARCKIIFAQSPLKKWSAAIQQARSQLGITGFCALGGKTAQGQALLAKVKAILGK